MFSKIQHPSSLSYIFFASSLSKIFFASNPPAKPVKEWLEPMTRWHGMMMLMPFEPMACATALMPLRFPTLWAISL